jgi:tRNA (guanine-N7-)-methyltransferase
VEEIGEERLYGRRKSKRLSNRQETLLETLLPSVSVSTFADLPRDDFRRRFLEVGFGSGEHLLQLALGNNEDLFIGCESFVNGVASLLRRMDEYKTSNIRIYHGDARRLMKEMPPEYLDGIFLLFPDPWPKRKHIGRRFLQEHTITSIHSILKNGGFLRIATDHDAYKCWIARILGLEKTKNLFRIQTYTKGNRPSQSSWPQTRYELKAEREIFYVICTKSVDK